MFLQILIHFVSSLFPPRVCVCLYLYTILYIYIHTYTRTNTHTNTNTHTHARTQGGSVEIGEMLINKDGSIDSDQMKQFTDTLAKMEDGLAKATATIEVLTADNGALKARVFDLETAAASTGSSSGASSSELAAVKADLATLAANHTKDMAELSETFSKEIVVVNTTLATTMSTVVYADGVHPGGVLDFTEGSAFLAILKETLPGVKVFLSYIEIKGSNIKGSVVSELLKDVAVVGGDLRCNNDMARFATDDDELVFASLRSVTKILMESNNGAADSRGYAGPSSVSFPALVFVPGNVELSNNKLRLKNISMPKLVGVGGAANFYENRVLTTLQLPSLLTVRTNFLLYELPKLTTDEIKVSQQFKYVGAHFEVSRGGFICTTDNGLKAVVQGASTLDRANIASCRK